VLGGAEIILVVYGFSGINNRKLGPMIEASVFVAAEKPSTAADDGRDSAVCGDCPGRPTNWGYCYVQIPVEVDKTWEAARDLPADLKLAYAQIRDSGWPIRLGVYGDAAAVPFEIVEALVQATATEDGKLRYSGFTHQWSHPNFDHRHLKYLAPSVEFVAEREELKQHFPTVMTYRIVRNAEEMLAGEIKCKGGVEPEADKCCECMSCGGTEGIARRDRVVVVHGVARKEKRLMDYLANPEKNARHVNGSVMTAAADVQAAKAAAPQPHSLGHGKIRRAGDTNRQEFLHAVLATPSSHPSPEVPEQFEDADRCLTNSIGEGPKKGRRPTARRAFDDQTRFFGDPRSPVTTTSGAACYLGYTSPAAIRVLKERGQIKPAGRRVSADLYSKKDLDAFLGGQRWGDDEEEDDADRARGDLRDRGRVQHQGQVQGSTHGEDQGRGTHRGGRRPEGRACDPRETAYRGHRGEGPRARQDDPFGLREIVAEARAAELEAVDAGEVPERS